MSSWARVNSIGLASAADAILSSAKVKNNLVRIPLAKNDQPYPILLYKPPLTRT
jgi:hypothetical protein